MLISLVSLLNVSMGSHDESFRVSLHTRQIIRRSKLTESIMPPIIMINNFRTLLACIKFLAQCPCPRCLIQKDKIGELGTTADRRRRENYPRQDNNSLWANIQMVRDWLYVKGMNITSVFIKCILGPNSLTATAVRIVY